MSSLILPFNAFIDSFNKCLYNIYSALDPELGTKDVT